MVNEADIQAIKELIKNFDGSHSSIDFDKLQAALDKYSLEAEKPSGSSELDNLIKQIKEQNTKSKPAIPQVTSTTPSKPATPQVASTTPSKSDEVAKQPEFSYTASSFGLSVLQRAKSDLSNQVKEDLGANDGKRIREYFKNLNSSSGQPWCAAAVSTWMKEAGGGPVPGALGALNIGRQFKSAGKWVDKKDIKPEHLSPGNIVVWTRPSGGPGAGHIGVISSSSGSSFTSIEGNSGPQGDRVYENSHSINDGKLVGIGILSDMKPKNAYKKTEQLIKLAARYQLKYY